MTKRDIKSDYRGWRFRDKVPLIPREQQWFSYFNSKFDDIDIDVDVDIDTDDLKQYFKTTIEEDLSSVHEHIDNAECHINTHIDEAKCHLCCKINDAKNNINHHIDEKIEPILHFEENFSNLNEQVQQILGRLN